LTVSAEIPPDLRLISGSGGDAIPISGDRGVQFIAYLTTYLPQCHPTVAGLWRGGHTSGLVCYKPFMER